MEINRNNYEAYLLDHLEQQLSPGQSEELMAFLAANPDLPADLEGFDALTLSPDDTIRFPGKESLKKNEVRPYAFLTEENYGEYFVASIDGELSAEEEKDLEIFLGLNLHLRPEYDAFAATVLTPDDAVVYPDKSSLKRAAFGTFIRARGTVLYRSLAVAASLALLAGLFFEFNPFSRGPQLAGVTPEQSGYSVPGLHPGGVTPPETTSAAGTPAAARPLQEPEQPVTHPARPADLKPVGNRVPGTGEEINSLAGIPATSLPVYEDSRTLLAYDHRSYFTELTGYMQLRDQREYFEYLDAREHRPMLARAADGVRSWIFGPAEYDPKGVRRDHELWNLAEAGLKGFNYITNSNLRLLRELDEDGKTVSYAVISDRLEYSGKVGK